MKCAKKQFFGLRLRALLCAVCLLAGCMVCFPVASAGAYPLAVIHNPNAPHMVHLRSGAGTSTKSYGEFASGSLVVVRDKTSADWWKVELGGREGYIQARFLIACGEQGHVNEAAAESAYSAVQYGVVSNPDPTERLHLRAKPSETSNSISKFYNGTPVEIWGVTDGWYYVMIDGMGGYMLSQYIKKTDGLPAVADLPAEVSEAGLKAYAVVNNSKVEDRLHLRAEAREGSQSLGRYYNGTTVEVLSTMGEWTHVRVFDQTGYMYTQFLAPDGVDKVCFDTGVVIGEPGMDMMPLREYPADDAIVTCVAYTPRATRVTVLGRAGIWYHVEIGGQEGYLQTQWVIPGTMSSEPDLYRQYGVIASPNARDRLHLREKPSTSAASLGQYFNGTQVELLERPAMDTLNWNKADGWYRVRVNGKEGYLMARFVMPVFSGQLP